MTTTTTTTTMMTRGIATRRPPSRANALAARASTTLRGDRAVGRRGGTREDARRWTRGDGRARRGRARTRAMPAVKALVQVDLGPSVVLGSSLMISAIALYQVRAARPEVSRDKDVFFSSIGLLCGGILIFQGWRLDPLMLFGQLLTTATAVAFATETISLRQELLDVEDAGDSGTRGRPGRGQRGRRSGRVRSLPPVNDRNVESRVDYGARRGYSRENDEESEDAFYAATAASYGNRRAARSSTGARRGDDGDFYDIDADVSDSFDGEQSDDDASPYRDGFRAAAGDASSTPRPSSGKNWENDDWDFV